MFTLHFIATNQIIQVYQSQIQPDRSTQYSEIYKITQHLQYLCRELTAEGGGVMGAKYACTLIFGR